MSNVYDNYFYYYDFFMIIVNVNSPQWSLNLSRTQSVVNGSTERKKGGIV